MASAQRSLAEARTSSGGATVWMGFGWKKGRTDCARYGIKLAISSPFFHEGKRLRNQWYPSSLCVWCTKSGQPQNRGFLFLPGHWTGRPKRPGLVQPCTDDAEAPGHRALVGAMQRGLSLQGAQSGSLWAYDGWKETNVMASWILSAGFGFVHPWCFMDLVFPGPVWFTID